MRFLTLVVALFVVAMISQVTDVAQNSASVVEADTGVRFMVVDAATGRSDVTVGPEGQARIKIIAEGAQAIAGAQFHMIFAPSMIRVNASSVLPGNLGTGSLFEHNVDNAQGRLSIAFARPSPVGAHSFTVAEAELTVNVAAGECTLLSIHELIVVNGSVPPAQVPATVSDGSVCNRVSKPVELSIVTVDGGNAAVDVPSGGSVKMKLIADNARLLAGIQAVVKFDPTVVNIPQGGVVIGPLLSGFASAFNVDNSHGELSLALANAQSLGAESAVIAEIEFRVLRNASACTSLSLENVIVGDGSIPSKPLRTQLREGLICVAESGGAPVEFKPTRVLASPGHVFKLDLWTNVPPTQEVTGVEVYIKFNPELLTVVNPITRVPTTHIQSTLEDLPIVLANTVDNLEGTFVYSAGTLAKPHPRGALKFASVTFNVNSAAPLDVNTQVRFKFAPGETTKVSVGGFTIPGTHRDATVEINAGLTGRVRLEGASRPIEGFEAPVTVKFYAPGVPLDRLDAVTPLRTIERETAPVQTPDGLAAEFFMPGAPLGRFDVTIDSVHTLMNIVRGVEIGSETRILDFGTLVEGDADDSGVIDILDFTLLAQGFLKCEGKTGFDARTDFDRSGCVNILDFTLFAQNFLRASPILVR
ncbi:MAG: hypothetical protein IIB17_00760 [Chloroflexi bacterium]|nr:hypothetical protein [Chloroflexota bacterium]